MTKAVINASPLILLAKGGLLGILSNLFESLVVPEPVLSEISVRPDDEVIKQFASLPLLVKLPVAPEPEVQSWDLGKGETAVISYALCNPGFVAILDDAEARACCRALGLRTMGTGALLIAAKEKDLLPSVREALVTLHGQGYWISDDVCKVLCSRAGEIWP